MTTTNITNFRKNAFNYVEQTIKYNEPLSISTKDGDAVLLSNHGLVACGRDLKSAYGLACNLEYVAELQYRTMCIGTPNILTDEQMAEVMERFRSYGQPGSGKAGY